MNQLDATVGSVGARLGEVVRGGVRFDRLSRTLYATDASIYSIVPAGVVLPRDVDDVVSTVGVCREQGVPIVARGAGTGLTGGAVGAGVQIDFSRYMNDVGAIDVERRRVRVGAGAVLDDVNGAAAEHGLTFAPDVATSSRATLGGMIANNSCGAHSVVYGRTVDHVAGMTAVLDDGSVVRWGENAGGTVERGDRAERIETELGRIATEYREEVAARFPKVMRRNGGYALDRICGGRGAVNPADIVCGSEGTLCLVVEAVLKLVPTPRRRGMLVVHFEAKPRDSNPWASATPLILEHGPAAVELIDRMILDAARRDGMLTEPGDSVNGGAGAVLVVEFFGDDVEGVRERLTRLREDLESKEIGYGHRVIESEQGQRAVWEMRKQGLGLLMSRPGDVQGYAFVEDTAVDPSRLRDYIDRFGGILREEGVDEAGYYAHASVGVIHVRPALNLKTAAGVSRMVRVAERVSDLALEFGGAMTGEHGDGLVRSCWLEKMYGSRLVGAFREVKAAFDPSGLFNPGKIVDAVPMTENLRYGAGYRSVGVKTHLDFGAYGGMAGMAEMCSGLGKCRQRGVGTMCPSFVATRDERHTTRARANALRAALSDGGLLRGLGDSALDEVMDLCVMCKACKTECPTGVDMGRLKAEWLSHRNRRVGVDRGARFSADAPRWARMGSRWPRLTNLVLGSAAGRRVLEARYGLDRRVAMPRLATCTFRRWFARRRRRGAERGGDARSVVYFVDTWTNCFRPEVGVAAVRLLEAAGYRVVVPALQCCGRTLISKGLLEEARHLAGMNIDRLARFADRGVPIVGTEPSCLLTLVDEYPQLVRGADARMVAGVARTVESFLWEAASAGGCGVRFGGLERRILYHAHCHQTALVGSAPAVGVLNLPPGFRAEEIDSGCCGMAGSFGHEKDHYAVAAAIGAERLFPAVRGRGGAEIAVSGFSCREQIAHHTGVAARHVVEHLADALAVAEGAGV